MSSTVLVVDDEVSIRVLVRMVLEDDGYTVVEAETGRQGLELVDAAAPDLVLLDIRLPDIDGWEVLRELSARPSAPRVVIMSAHSSAPTLERAKREGSSGYLIKPFKHSELLDVVAETTVNDRSEKYTTGPSGPVAGLCCEPRSRKAPSASRRPRW